MKNDRKKEIQEAIRDNSVPIPHDIFMNFRLNSTDDGHRKECASIAHGVLNRHKQQICNYLIVLLIFFCSRISL